MRKHRISNPLTGMLYAVAAVGANQTDAVVLKTVNLSLAAFIYFSIY
jgi:hypothetical protein